MRTPKSRPTDPDEIVRVFQKRQKQIALAFLACFSLMIPLAMLARTIHPILSLVVMIGFIIPLIVFYIQTFRCPACGARVRQRRQMLRMPIHCAECKSLLDPH